jgi:hypothetical protein
MKKALLTFALVTGPALAEESKPVATQVGEAVAPVAEGVGNTMTRIITEFMAGGNGMLAEGARANLKAQDKREREANRGVRRSMKECIKPRQRH